MSQERNDKHVSTMLNESLVAQLLRGNQASADVQIILLSDDELRQLRRQLTDAARYIKATLDIRKTKQK